MRRRTQKSLAHLLILLFILALILFLNRPQSPHRLFAWDRVRYRTRAETLPPPNGVCPGLSDSRPALVVSLGLVLLLLRLRIAGHRRNGSRCSFRYVSFFPMTSKRGC